jgi:TP901 family phage tail tape measure protein
MSNTLNLAYTVSAIDKLTPVLKKIEAQIKKLEQSFKKLDATIKIKADTKAANQAIQKLSKDTQSTHTVNVVEKGGKGGSSSSRGRSGSKVFGHIGAGIGGGMGYMGLSGAMSNPYVLAGAAAAGSLKAYADVETAQLSLAKALDVDSKLIKDVGVTTALGKTAKDLAALSSELGVAQTEIVGTATEFAKIGISGTELVTTVKYTAAAAEAWGTNLEDTQSTFIMLKETYGLTAEGLLDVANKIDLVGDKMGLASEKSINEWLGIASKTGAAFKLGAETMIAFGTTATESGVALPTAQRDLNTIMSNATSPKAQKMLANLGAGEDLGKYKAMTNEDKLGFTLKTINKALKEGKDVSKDLAAVYGKDLAVSIMKMAMSYDKYEESLNLVKNNAELDGRVLEGLALKAQTLEGQFNKLKTAVINGAINMGSALNSMIQSEGMQAQLSAMGQSFSSMFGGVSNDANQASADVRGFTNVLVALGLVVNTLLWFLESVGNLLSYIGKLTIALFTLDGGFLTEANQVYAENQQRANELTAMAWSDGMWTMGGNEQTINLNNKLPTKKIPTKPAVTAPKQEAAKEAVGIKQPPVQSPVFKSTAPNTTQSSTTNVLGVSTQAAATQEGAAVKQTTAAEQNLLAAQANKEAAMANQQASIVFKAGADRLASVPTPSVSYSFMPPLGNQGR